MNNIKNKTIRQIAIDTETTGINTVGAHYIGHRIIEIAGVEIINRHLTGNDFHIYLNPKRKIDHSAFIIHRIKDEFLTNKPSFKEIADKFLSYISNSELIIHNAMFDVGFINQELKLSNSKIKNIELICKITDTLSIARTLHSGKRNSLDALSKRYNISNKSRYAHSALLDATILAKVFLLMTGGQTSFQFGFTNNRQSKTLKLNNRINTNKKLIVIHADKEEIKLHKKYLDWIKKKYKFCIWSK